MPKQPMYGAPNEPNVNYSYGYQLGQRDCARAHHGEFVRFMAWIANNGDYRNGYTHALADGGCDLQDVGGGQFYVHVLGTPVIASVGMPGGDVSVSVPSGPLPARMFEATPVTRRLATPAPRYAPPWRR